MNKPIYYEHGTNKNDFGFIDYKGRNGTAYRVCRTGKPPKTFSMLASAKLFLEEQGYKHNPKTVAMY